MGDEIVAIDGESVARRLERLRPLISASTPQALRTKVHQLLLVGPEKSRVKLRVRKADGALREIEMERAQRIDAFWNLPPRTTPVFGVLPSGYGYIDLARLPYQDADKAMDAVSKTPGLIFDMRGYPNGTAWVIAPRLAAKQVIAARFERAQWSGAELGDPNDIGEPRFTFPQSVEPNPSKPRYTGRVVMLINAEAASGAVVGEPR